MQTGNEQTTEPCHLLPRDSVVFSQGWQGCIDAPDSVWIRQGHGALRGWPVASQPSQPCVCPAGWLLPSSSCCWGQLGRCCESVAHPFSPSASGYSHSAAAWGQARPRRPRRPSLAAPANAALLRSKPPAPPSTCRVCCPFRQAISAVRPAYWSISVLNRCSC